MCKVMLSNIKKNLDRHLSSFWNTTCTTSTAIYCIKTTLRLLLSSGNTSDVFKPRYITACVFFPCIHFSNHVQQSLNVITMQHVIQEEDKGHLCLTLYRIITLWILLLYLFFSSFCHIPSLPSLHRILLLCELVQCVRPLLFVSHHNNSCSMCVECGREVFNIFLVWNE